MSDDVPILVYFEKKELDAIGRLVKEKKYPSRSEFIRSSLRLFVGTHTDGWERKTPETIEPEFVKLAGGDRNLAAEMYFDDLRKKKRQRRR